MCEVTRRVGDWMIVVVLFGGKCVARYFERLVMTAEFIRGWSAVGWQPKAFLVWGLGRWGL